MKINIVVGSIPYNKGKILLVKNKGNKFWYPPSGKLEQNETLKDGARRETLEETGIDVNLIRLLYVKEYHVNNKLIIKLVWLAKPKNIKILPKDKIFMVADGLDKELEAMRWFDKKSIQKANIFPPQLKKELWKVIENPVLIKNDAMLKPFIETKHRH